MFKLLIKMEKGVNISLHFSNKTFYLLIGIIAAFSVLGVVYATFSSTEQYHESEEVKITIDGEDYSLQDAIDGGMIGDSVNEQITLSCNDNCVTPSCPENYIRSGCSAYATSGTKAVEAARPSGESSCECRFQYAGGNSCYVYCVK